MSILQKRLLLRFVRSFVAGFISASMLVIPTNIKSFHELSTWITTLLIAGSVGAISGILQAGDMYLRSYDTPPTPLPI